VRKKPDPILSIARIRVGTYASTDEIGNNGAFLITTEGGATLKVIASDGTDKISDHWEHVSVSVNGVARCPSWAEMCFVKDLFWNDDEVVIQFHPAKKDYVNFHPYCLHLWRNRLPSRQTKTPPPLLVGPQRMEY
jgi:hypothetical protein